MVHKIVIEFPDKEMAERFCSQMSDGFGEGFCSFSYWKQKPNTTGKSKDDFERIYDEQGREVYFVTEVEA